MDALKYGDFSLKLHKGLLAAGRAPLNGTLEVTRRCPLTCQHCYNNLPVGDRDALQSELSLEELQRIMDEMAEAGCLWLLLTGGEVFARKDFLDIYDYAITKGFLVTVFTNATMITPAIADHLAAKPPFSIEVTLYGYHKETYELLTKLPGSYDRCMRGVELLRERGLPLKLKTVATTITKDEIRDMQSFAEDELGVEFKFDGLINPRVDCSQSPLHVRLSPSELVELDLEDEKRVDEWRKLSRNSAALTNPVSDDVYHCGGGMNSFAIDPWGRLTICVLSQQESFDLRKGSFSEGWNGFLKMTREKKRKQMTKCVRCGIKDMCGMCAANGELHNEGDAEKPVEFLCETAHLRAHAFDINVPEHGECEYCQGGIHHAKSIADAQQLKQQQSLKKAHPRRLPMKRRLKVASENEASCGGCSSCH